jgi:hypothetical protein
LIAKGASGVTGAEGATGARGASMQPRIQSKWIGKQPFYIHAGSSAKLSATMEKCFFTRLDASQSKVIWYTQIRGELAEGGDFLGIVSGRDVVIADSTISGAGDLKIDASIYAKSQFKVKNHRSSQNATLHLFGSVSAISLGATEPRYATNIVFDQRLENIRPPGFPVTNRYELAASEQDWNEDGWLDTKPQETPIQPRALVNQ